MKKGYCFIVVAMALLAAAGCTGSHKEMSHDELISAIDSIQEPLIKSARVESIDTAQGNKLVNLYVKFADKYPDDTLSALYLHRAAQIATGMGQIDDMVAYYDRVMENYPDYKYLDECYYFKGIALDNAGRKEEARKAYQEFLEEYPDHFLVQDIKNAISLLDVSDEVLGRMLMEQNQ